MKKKMNGNANTSLLGPILLPTLTCFFYSAVYVTGRFGKMWDNKKESVSYNVLQTSIFTTYSSLA